MARPSQDLVSPVTLAISGVQAKKRAASCFFSSDRLHQLQLAVVMLVTVDINSYRAAMKRHANFGCANTVVGCDIQAKRRARKKGRKGNRILTGQ
uniref:Uncharacterized protein n=1 Tax=Oryza glumipatula TaxID=40148 RepID=A0A0E0AT17_9ORYZ